MYLNVEIAPGLTVRDGVLTIRDVPVPRFQLDREMARGANGVVFSAQRLWLKQPCAVKVWLKLRAEDQRDKIRQGLFEAQKVASANPEWAVSVFDADMVEGIFFTSMELVDGETLRALLRSSPTKQQRWQLADCSRYARPDSTIPCCSSEPHKSMAAAFRRT